MTTRLKFLHVCERDFAGLPGADAQRRRCEQCATVVHNLDAMTLAQRVEVLAQAEREKTTVCVSLTVPEADVETCRGGKPVEFGLPEPPRPPGIGIEPPRDFVPLAGVAVRHDSFVVPEPGPVVETEAFGGERTFVEDVPTVSGALAEAAAELGLSEQTGGREARWRLRSAEPDVTIDVAVKVIGGATAVSLSIVAVGLREPLETPSRGPGFVVGSVLLCAAGGAWLVGWQLAAAIGVGLAVLYVAIYAATIAVLRRRRSPLRRAVAWGRAWEGRFWPAVQGRLATRRPYRTP